MQVTAHKQGTPSWFELATNDEDASLSFYSQLFGWSDESIPLPEGGAYHQQLIGGDPVSAIAAQQADEAAQGIPPHWNVYLTVDDLDAVAGKVEAGGGNTIMPPFDVMDVGRMAVISDPTGGVVCLWEAKSSIGARRMREAGAPAWAELMTKDSERAAAFFSSLLGVQANKLDMPDAHPYTVLKVDGQDAAGIMQITPEMGEMPPAWTAYFGVDDVDASTARAESLGAQVMVPPTDIPDGRFAVLSDPQQAVFGIYKANQ